TGGHSPANPAAVVVVASGVEVRNNILSGSTASQYNGLLTVAGANDLVVSGNAITGNFRGVYLNPGSGHTIENNEISDNATVGIGSDGQSHLTITGNVFSN